MKDDIELNSQSMYIKKDRFKRILFFILMSLSVIQQMPVIKDVYYNQIRIVLYISFGLFSIVSFFYLSKFFRVNLVKFFSLTVIYTLLLFFTIKMIGNNRINVFELLIPFGILSCSLHTKFSKKQLSTILIWYILLSALLGITSIFYYGEGFTITMMYFLEAKNQVGPILGISTIITGIWILNKNQIEIKHNKLIFRIILFIILILIILIIRNRSSLLGIFITLFLYLLKDFKLKRRVKNILIIQAIFLVLIITLFLGGFDKFINFIYMSLFYNFDITNLNSISAGRVNIYKNAIDFIIQNPILGELGISNFIYSTPHNYILNKWVNFGIVGSLPYIAFYLYLWFFTLKYVFSSKSKSIFSLPLWVLLFSLVISLLEYTYPYGPGVSQLMVWFLLGQYCREKY